MGSSIDDEGSPSIYGGLFINYQISSKLNFNVNPYFYSAHTLSHYVNVNISSAGERGVAHVDSKVLLNAKISYAPIKNMAFFVSGKNLSNSKSFEFFKTDLVRALFLLE